MYCLNCTVRYSFKLLMLSYGTGIFLQDIEEPGPSTTTVTPAKGKKPKPSTSAATPKQPRQPKATSAAATAGGRAKLRNVDRKNATVHSVTVDNVTIAITEYRLKPKKEKKEKATESLNNSSNSKAASNHSDAESDSMEPSGQDRSS